MLDTVVLVMHEGYTIQNPDRFEPSARILTEGSGYMGGRGYMQCKQNPTKSELKAGFYKPRLTLTKRFTNFGTFGLSLKIELSLPKLIYGNNFDELNDSDFDKVLDKLQQRLKSMDVLVFKHVLANTLISSVHYSKNIPITDGRRPKYWMDKIAEANISKILDTNQVDYRNEGHLFKTHTNSFEIAFYDKIKDLEMSKISSKRSYENDNEIQLDLFDELKNRKAFFEVLRMEVRLNKRQKINSIFKKLYIFKEPTFQNIFSSEISVKVLLYYLDKIREKRPAIFDYRITSTKKFLTETIISNPNIGANRLFQILGAKLAFDEFGMRETRNILDKYSNRSWYRLVNQIKNVKYPNRIDPLTEIRNKLLTYDALDLIDYKNHLINNDKNETN
ncbi:hypothetical protein KA111_00525 [Candidatus Woesebacteria bacterium]|nr:hypothetical protein [Candidatus Woesebacteria bacterium]